MVQDPIMEALDESQLEPDIPVRVSVILGLAVALSSVLSFIHAVRLTTHLVYFMPAHISLSKEPQACMESITLPELQSLMDNIQVAQTLGMRLIFLFIPMLLWLAGLTPLIVSSTVLTVFTYLSDRHKMPVSEKSRQARSERLTMSETMTGSVDQT